MNKTRCVHCGKELEYDGFCCPTMCDECNNKWLDGIGIKSTEYHFADRRYIARQMGVDKVHCIICDEEIQLTENEFNSAISGYVFHKICNKCKKAVMKMRGESNVEDN